MMKLGLFINPTGHHQAAWRHAGSQADAGVNLAHYIEIARLAEQAKIDAIFLADNQGVRPGAPEAVHRVAQYVANFEPLTLLSALAAVTERIGLIATASTTYNFPFQVARKFASLDHLSHGRAGWNIVTGGTIEVEKHNFGGEDPDHPRRYLRAAEFVEVCRGLWDSWDDDAFPRDKASGIFSVASKLHRLDHHGEFFKIRGPLNVPRPPQGYPVHVQAGASDDGKAFAARYGEMIFVTPMGLAPAQATYKEIKEKAASYGRDPDQIKIMPGLAPVIGKTEAEAKEKFEELQSLLSVPVTLNILGMRMGGMDLTGLNVDEPLPEGLEVTPRTRRQYGTMLEHTRKEGLTLRQLALKQSGSLAGLSVHGSVEQIADMMEEWFRSGACDGFNLQPATFPGVFRDVVELLIPELRRRGLFRSEYEGKTLRANLGLSRPPSRYAT
jgi:FMN-dependent oxidoreductase (nitrilotriacetate monooxygenase family)